MSEYSENIKISPKMADIIMKSKNYLYTWLEGSAQSGKSVTAALALSLLIEDSSPNDKLFLALGYTVTSAKNNIFECGGFGVRYYFGGRCKPCKYQGVADALEIQTKTGIKYLVAFGTSTRTSNNVWHGWKVSGFLFDEIDRACQESIDEMKQRILAVSDPHIIVTQNPNVPTHPIYEFLNNLLKNDMANYSHWTLDDNVGLTPEKVAMNKAMYDPDSIFYKRYILGERINPAGIAFRLYDYNYLDKPREQYKELYVIMDTGMTRSATGIIALGIYFDTAKGKFNMDIIDEYYWLNNEHKGHEKMYPDTAQDLANFVKNIRDVYNLYPTNIIIDESPEMYRNVLLKFRENSLPTQNIKYPIKDTDEERVKRIETLLYQGRLKICRACEHTIISLRDALFDDKYMEAHGKIKLADNYDNEGHSDLLDCVSYGTKWLGNKLYI